MARHKAERPPLDDLNSCRTADVVRSKAMSARVKRMVEEAKQLPENERQLLLSELDALDDTAPEEISAAWDAELARRIEDIDSGHVALVPIEQVMAEALALARK